MTDTKWTPGPWRAAFNKKFGWWSVCHSGWCEKGETSIVVRVEDYQDEPQKTASAHLIAASPELYQALDYLAQLGKGTTVVEWEEGLKMAYAALAKARGESND